jgi:hypothetical protein
MKDWAAIVGTVFVAVLSGCSDDPYGGQTTDPALYAPPTVRRPVAEIPAEPRMLEPTEVAGVELVPREFYEGKLRLLLPKQLRELPVPESMRDSGPYPLDILRMTPGTEFRFAMGLSDIPQLASRVDDEFGYVSGQIESSYPPGSVKSKQVALIDGRHWIQMEIESDKRLFVSMTSLNQRWLRIEVMLAPGADAKWAEVVRKMWENSITADGHY